MAKRLRVAGVCIGLSLLLAPVQPAFAVERCKAKIQSKDGRILVSAKNVTGMLRWGEEAGQETNSFDPGCFNAAGDAIRKCPLGAEGTLARITPPAGCTLYLADDVGACAAALKKCTPGVRPARGLRLRVAGVTFRARNPATSVNYVASGCVHSSATNVAGLLVKSLELPQGARIRALTAYTHDAAAGRGTLYLTRYTGTGLLDFASVDSTGNAGFVVNTVAVDHRVDNTADALVFNWIPDVADSTLRLCAAEVTYDLPPPDPGLPLTGALRAAQPVADDGVAVTEGGVGGSDH